eukprot:CAMPEP_0181336826 /NCGR_PEP_ID=MMETSP1101-20121128/27650_1 /TAXON_ID=46948 /ORGANISM="Rhodomonas abbreviata, Strain Caron Lab Isolate" /LENGTH=143 /DNA_ID=CAMNT_0023447195 /DNA_START=82 /DNA_END=513 /DNA_ORIENTATION=-
MPLHEEVGGAPTGIDANPMESVRGCKFIVLVLWLAFKLGPPTGIHEKPPPLLTTTDEDFISSRSGGAGIVQQLSHSAGTMHGALCCLKTGIEEDDGASRPEISGVCTCSRIPCTPVVNADESSAPTMARKAITPKKRLPMLKN